MREVSDSIEIEVDEMKRLYQRELACPAGKIQEFVLSPIVTQKDKITVRASYVFLWYKYLKLYAKKKKFSIKPLPKNILKKIAFLADASMVMMYQYNHIYDDKHVGDDPSYHKYILGRANIFKDLIDDYVDELRLEEEQKKFIKKTIKMSFKHVDLGQLIDQVYDYKSLISNESNYEAMICTKGEFVFPKAMEKLIQQLQNEYPEYDNVFQTYFARIYLINSSLLQSLSEILFELTGFPKKRRHELLTFPKLMGLYMQVVNDCTDFVLDSGNSNKTACNVLSDLRNHTVSLPVVFHFVLTGKKQRYNQENNVAETNYIRNYIFNSIFLNEKSIQRQSFGLDGKHNEVLREVIESGAMDKTMKIGKKIAEAAENTIIKSLEIKTEEEKNSLLSEMLDLPKVAFWNRYYYHIRKAKKAYEKGVFYRCEDYISSRKEDLVMKTLLKQEI